MASFVKVIKKSEIANGSKKTVFTSGKRIMIANVDGQFFALDDACTHAGCSLGTEGVLEGSVITCGCHGSQFEVGSGKVLNPPANVSMGTYEVKTEGDDVLVAL